MFLSVAYSYVCAVVCGLEEKNDQDLQIKNGGLDDDKLLNLGVRAYMHTCVRAFAIVRSYTWA